MVVKLLVSKYPVLLKRLTLPNQSDLIASPTIQMPVETIVTHIQLPTGKPFDLGLVKIPF
jgi:hypothetical protein